MNASWDAAPDPLESLQGGDKAPFEGFVRAAALDLVGFFRRLGAGAQDAEDLTQELFLKMYRHHPSYQPQGRFRAYVLRTARNAWVDRVRREGIRPRTLGGEPDGPDPVEQVPSPDQGGPGQGLERHEVQGQVTRALGTLSEAHRDVFELGVVQELPYAQIADLLGVPVGTVKSRMFHAVRRLRETLGELGEAEGLQEPEEGGR